MGYLLIDSFFENFQYHCTCQVSDLTHLVEKIIHESEYDGNVRELAHVTVRMQHACNMQKRWLRWEERRRKQEFVSFLFEYSPTGKFVLCLRFLEGK